MKKPKLRELAEAFRSLVHAPDTAGFPFKPHQAMPGFRGRPVPDEKACIACGACAQVCPARAIEVIDSLAPAPAMRQVIWHYDLCIYCGQCERLCTTTSGVKLSREYELSTFQRTSLWSQVEHELTLCERCGVIIAPRVQLHWLFERIGPLASGNMTLLYTQQNVLRVVDHPVAPGGPPDVTRADLFRVMCPKCRHTVLVFNQTGQR